jgi:hypothetical protein
MHEHSHTNQTRELKLLIILNTIDKRGIIMKLHLPAALILSIFSLSVLADNIIRAPAPVTFKPISHENWVTIDPLYSDWSNSGSPYGCTNWTPDPTSVAIGVTFEQTATDCQQDQTRTRQEREQESTSLIIRNAGAPITENRAVSATSSRESIGTNDEATLSRYFTFVRGSNSGQFGCFGQSACMSIPAESSMQGKSSTYMSFGYGNAINFGLSGYSGNQLKAALLKLRVEMFDAQGNKIYTVTQNAPFSNQYGNYVGNSHSSNDYQKSIDAYKMRVSFELIE